ncbi:hypothetical protein FGIG_10789 [Fasciola gigantica]|uniref:Uncharacterized protein n=1 Tax=Fasciola gigantica TaxID=46835 RepID=A0A504YK59_FASGI|nr:hypothetical protein FGIG_10789 [Fasciola gigantica]
MRFAPKLGCDSRLWPFQLSAPFGKFVSNFYCLFVFVNLAFDLNIIVFIYPISERIYPNRSLPYPYDRAAPNLNPKTTISRHSELLSYLHSFQTPDKCMSIPQCGRVNNRPVPSENLDFKVVQCEQPTKTSIQQQQSSQQGSVDPHRRSLLDLPVHRPPLIPPELLVDPPRTVLIDLPVLLHTHALTIQLPNRSSINDRSKHVPHPRGSQAHRYLTEPDHLLMILIWVTTPHMHVIHPRPPRTCGEKKRLDPVENRAERRFRPEQPPFKQFQSVIVSIGFGSSQRQWALCI